MEECVFVSFHELAFLFFMAYIALLLIHHKIDLMFLVSVFIFKYLSTLGVWINH